MSVPGTYRRLLTALRRKLGSDKDKFFADYVRNQFRARSGLQEPASFSKLLTLADEYALHLDKTTAHTDMLKRYNITVNADTSQRAQVQSIANKVGLTVPEQAEEAPRSAAPGS